MCNREQDRIHAETPGLETASVADLTSSLLVRARIRMGQANIEKDPFGEEASSVLIGQKILTGMTAHKPQEDFDRGLTNIRGARILVNGAIDQVRKARDEEKAPPLTPSAHNLDPETAVVFVVSEYAENVARQRTPIVQPSAGKKFFFGAEIDLKSSPVINGVHVPKKTGF